MCGRPLKIKLSQKSFFIGNLCLNDKLSPKVPLYNSVHSHGCQPAVVLAIPDASEIKT